MCDAGRMPFGKHRGRAIVDLPSRYLRFLLGLDDLEPWLRTQVQAELERRGERLVSAVEVMTDAEEEVLRRVCEDEEIEFETAARLGDHLLEGFAAVREKHGIGTQTDMVIGPAKHDPGEQQDDERA